MLLTGVTVYPMITPLRTSARRRTGGRPVVTDQRVAVVTGVSSGIGEATVRHLAAAGLRVFGAGRRSPKHRLAGVEHVTIDVDDEESVRDAVADILIQAGQIDVLVNNAGLMCAGAIERGLDRRGHLRDQLLRCHPDDHRRAHAHAPAT